MRRQVPMAQERVVRLCANDPAARLHVRSVATLGRPPQRRRRADASAKSTAARAAAAGRSPPRRGRAATAPLAAARACGRTETRPLRPVGSAAATLDRRFQVPAAERRIPADDDAAQGRVAALAHRAGSRRLPAPTYPPCRSHSPVPTHPFPLTRSHLPFHDARLRILQSSHQSALRFDIPGCDKASHPIARLPSEHRHADGTE
jgi:hypothetical protein